MTVPRAGKVAAVVLLLIAAAGAAAVYSRGNRDITTSSQEAYQAWRDGLENERRFYFKEARVGFARALQLDPQFAMAMIGLARNDLMLAEQWLRDPAARVPDELGRELLERLRSEDADLLVRLEKNYNIQLTFRADPNYHVENFKILDADTGEELR